MFIAWDLCTHMKSRTLDLKHYYKLVHHMLLICIIGLTRKLVTEMVLDCSHHVLFLFELIFINLVAKKLFYHIIFKLNFHRMLSVLYIFSH